jgi:AraC-like DNA-binding protein
LIGYEFTTEQLPESYRVDYARYLAAKLPTPLAISTDQPAGFCLQQHDLHLDTLRVWKMTMQPGVLHRTRRVIRESDPETFNIALLQHGTLERVGDRNQSTYRPYELHINDSSRPYEIRMRSEGGLISCLGVEIPKKLLPPPAVKARELPGRPLTGRQGIGALLTNFLVQLTGDTNSFQPTDGLRLGRTLVDLTCALLASALETDNILTPDSRRTNLTLQIRDFISQHLHDPQLSPRTVAAAHHISLSYLHRLFREEGTTVAAWIRQQRLESARRDLMDPSMATTSISEIAARWGFTHVAVFSRAYRAAYGTAPRDHRHEMLPSA